MWLAQDSDEPQLHQPRPDFLTMGQCGAPRTRWRFRESSDGHIASVDDPRICIGYHLGRPQALPPLSSMLVAPLPCAHAHDPAWSNYSFSWQLAGSGSSNATAASAGPPNATKYVALQAVHAVRIFGDASGHAPCLGVVRPNLNISCGLAAVITDARGQPLAFSASTLRSGDNTDPSFTASARYSLAPGRDYYLRVATETTRGAGVSANDSAVRRAIASARAHDHQALTQAHAAHWAAWWNASSVDLGPKRALLESFYCGAQYMLNSFSSSSGVIPGLLGPWSTTDPVGWADGITMDCASCHSRSLFHACA